EVECAFQFGVAIYTPPGGFLKTKVVEVKPRVVLLNYTGQTIHFRQTATSLISALSNGEASPFHAMDSSRPRRLSLRLLPYGWSWAAAEFGMAVDAVGTTAAIVR